MSLKATCEEILRLDGEATPGETWHTDEHGNVFTSRGDLVLTTDSTLTDRSDVEVGVAARNAAPAMARALQEAAELIESAMRQLNCTCGVTSGAVCDAHRWLAAWDEGGEPRLSTPVPVLWSADGPPMTREERAIAREGRAALGVRRRR